MHVVSGAVLDRWTALSDEEVVARVLEGQISRARAHLRLIARGAFRFAQPGCDRALAAVFARIS